MAALLASLVYDLGYWLTAFVLTFGFSVRVVGQRHVPRRGAALLIANHESYLDPLAVGLSTPRHLAYLGRKTLFKNPLMGGLLRTVNVVPIDQEGVGKEGIRSILDRLQAGQLVLVFPEGERTMDGRMNALRPGIALLISRVQVPILPVGVVGAYEAWPRWRKFPVFAPLLLGARRPNIAVAVGPARDPATVKGMPRAQMLETLARDIAAMMARARRFQRK